MSHQSDLDNYANQLNPNNDAYWESREFDERPDDWEVLRLYIRLLGAQGRHEAAEKSAFGPDFAAPGPA